MRRTAILVCTLCVLVLPSVGAQAPTLDSRARARAKAMLEDVRNVIKDNYYDPAFHGLDLDAHFKDAERKLETAQSLSHAMGIIAQAVLELGDSHTYFVPPARAESYDYGWQMQMIGDACLITSVRPGSDAAAKGLKPGDRLLRLDVFLPTRAELWKLQYLYYMLNPRTSVKVVVQGPGAAPRELELLTEVTKGPQLVDLSADVRSLSGRPRRAVVANKVVRLGDIAIWKFPSFGFDPGEVDGLVDDVMKGTASLVLDLRGNGGGLITTLQQLAGRLFEHDVTIGDTRVRGVNRPLVAKARKTPFTGRLVVVVDSNSASAAEMLARILQIETRAVIVGDQTAGSVMEARRHRLSLGLDTRIFYGASVAISDVIMPDGKSLERVGVVPDERLLPSADDLAAGRDPVLARAVAILGGTIDPAAAGRMFPVDWK